VAISVTRYPALTMLAGCGGPGGSRSESGATAANAAAKTRVAAAAARIVGTMRVLISRQEWIREEIEMLRRIVAFVAAAALMIVLGSAAHSYFVQRAWSMAATAAEGSDAVIPFVDRISWAVHDLGGMFEGYASLTSIALLIAFLIAGLVARFAGHRIIVFGIAGGASIFVMFTALRMILGTVGIFGARGPLGLAAQMLVGLLAGLLFARLTQVTRAAINAGTSRMVKNKIE
jgi:hypothetical protein